MGITFILRVSYLIDGFNFYHSARTAERHLQGRSTKWLDFRALFESLLYTIRENPKIKTRLQIEEIYYLSALATHLERSNPGITARHRSFIACLKDSGVQIKWARFKPKKIKCPSCSNSFTRYEEKETDVAIGAKLLELFALNACDIGIIVSGDTDICPAIACARKLYPDKLVGVAFPYLRKNKELKKLADFSIKISKEMYAGHQFSNPYQANNGRRIHKPGSW